MPQYRVLKRSFIDNHIREEGDVVNYDGYPSDNLEPLDAEGQAKQKEGIKAAKAAMSQMIRDAQPLGNALGFDQDTFAKAVAKAIADGVSALAAGQKATKAPPADDGSLT
jgi:hypothetical protein